MPRKISMVGTAASRVSAPVDDPTAEIWGVSSRGGLPRADRWFELHPIDYTFEKAGEADLWRKALSEFTADIPELWMMFPEPSLHPNVITYPLDYIKGRFGTEHMGSTFSWMMAIAIAEMAPIDPDGTRHFAEPGSKISIYGVDMEAGTEYTEQRKGFKAMMSIAKQLGIEVHLTLSGGLIYDPVPYPLWQLDPLICKVDYRLRESTSALVRLDAASISAREMVCITKGSISEVELAMAGESIAKALEGEDNPPVPYDPNERLKFLNKQLTDLKQTHMKISTDIISLSSVQEEQKWLRGYLMQ